MHENGVFILVILSYIVFLGVFGLVLRRVIKKIILLLSQFKFTKGLSIILTFLIALFSVRFIEYYPSFAGKLFTIVYYEMGFVRLFDQDFVPEYMVEVFIAAAFIVVFYVVIHLTLWLFFFVEEKIDKWQANGRYRDIE